MNWLIGTILYGLLVRKNPEAARKLLTVVCLGFAAVFILAGFAIGLPWQGLLLAFIPVSFIKLLDPTKFVAPRQQAEMVQQFHQRAVMVQQATAERERIAEQRRADLNRRAEEEIARRKAAAAAAAPPHDDDTPKLIIPNVVQGRKDRR